MKKVLVLIAACWVSAVSAFSTNPTNFTDFQDNYPHRGISFQVFYDNLSPYGDWVSYPGYGYVWVPAVGNGFSPYMSDGQWLYSDEGWTWASDYRWGWAPFHYGSWLYDDYYGWVWVPGYDWAPAWVTWGYYDGYYGWAPVMPGVYIQSYRPAVRYWHFVPAHHLCDRHVYRYEVDRRHSDRYVTHVTYINNYHRDRDRSEYNYGPGVDHVRQYGKFTPTQVRITEQTEAGAPQMRNGSVSMYRPQVERDNRDYRPANVTPRENVRSNNPRTQTGVTRDLRDNRPANDNPKTFKAEPQRDQKTFDKRPEPTRTQPANPQMDRREQKINGNAPNTRQKDETIKRDNRPVQQPRQQPQVRQSAPSQENRSTPARRSGGEMNPSSIQRHEAQPERSQPAHAQENHGQGRRH